jgi:hypothetical protein
LTATISLLHLSRADRERIQAQGWPLPYELEERSIRLAIPPRDTLDSFLPQLRDQGFSKPLLELLRWACDAGVHCLLLDAGVEPNDRLLVFVG